MTERPPGTDRRGSARAPPAWPHVQDVLSAALERPSGERSAFIAEASAGDAELEAEVHSLLAAHDCAGVLDRPVADLATGSFPLAPGSSPSPGRIAGRYEILDEVGAGGMGVVHRARDLRLGRIVALKFLSHHLGAGGNKDRFVVEARAAAGLDHPNICTIHEIGETDEGHLFIAMPFYDGETLKQRLARGSLPAEQATDIAIQVAEGLACAHEQGIVHRDIKPANVVLTSGGVVKIVDFGVAKLADVDLTHPGMTPGTAAYMSPEQASGEEVDGRTDLWSLGVLLHEMLVGERPVGGVPGGAFPDTSRGRDPPPIREGPPEVPAALQQVVRRALASAREDRFPTARDMVRALEATRRDAPRASAPDAGEGPQEGTAPLPGGRRRRMAVAIAVAAVTILSLAWFTVPRPAPPTIRSVAVLPLANISGDQDQTYFVDGLHDALIGELQRLSAFDRVISRTSVLRYRDTDERPSSPQIAAALGVDALIEGAVSLAVDQITVRLRLVAVDPEERVVWNHAYTGDAAEVTTLFRTITDEIADAIALSLTPTEEARLTEREPVEPAAYDSYLRGRAELDKRSGEGFQLAADYFERAIAIDSGYAAGWAGLSVTYNLLAQFGHIRLDVARENAQHAAERAIEADSTSAEALVSLAEVRFASREWTAAEEAYRQALQFNPGFAQAHHFYGWFLAHIGRFDEALEHLMRAQELDPLAPTIAADHSGALFYARRFDEARVQADLALDLQPDHPWALRLRSLLAIEGGRYAEAMRYTDRWTAVQSEYDDRAHLDVLAATGREEEVRALVEEHVERLGGRERIDAPLAVALGSAFATLGNVDEAFGWLEHAVDRGTAAGSTSLLGWPPFDPLRDDPRFEALLERMGYPR